MSGTSTAAGLTPTTANPYALPPQLQAFYQSLQNMQQQVGAANAPNSANYMRGNPGSAWTQGQPNNLLATILQMRAAQAAGLGAPYQQGVATPRVSLLNG